MHPFEIYEDPQTGVRFYFSHSSSEFTTGVMMIPPGTALPKHNRPLAIENLVQLAGKCEMTTFDDQDRPAVHVLVVDATLSMGIGQYHIHANPYQEASYTFFKAVGDITAIVENVRQNFVKIKPAQV
jgi:quercetin dioxygenase-like cupin family protein